MRLLPRQRLTLAYYKDEQERIEDALRSFIFTPLAGIVRQYNPQKKILTLLNDLSPDALIEALSSGRIQYKEGVFSGQFNAAIVRELVAMGAKYDLRANVYRLDPARVPTYVKMRAALYETSAYEAHRALLVQIDELQKTLDKGIPDLFVIGSDDVIGKIADGCAATAESLAVFPELDENGKKNLAREYTNNVALSITDFSKDMIRRLRRDVQDSAETGYRFDHLIGKISHKYGVTEAKAEFLARTETSIFMSDYRRERFTAAGINEYFWRTSGDSRVRSDHRDLNGKRFLYSMPPVADKRTGTTANPGGIWNCRCNDQPIVEG